MAIYLIPGSAPTTTEGAIYYDSTSDSVKVYNGTSWRLLNEGVWFNSGGNITTYTSGSTNYRVHIFKSSATFVAVEALTLDWLVVAGGGSGGSHHGAGGGAGGFRTGNAHTLSVGTYTVVVGAGGTSVTGSNSTGVSGSNSSFGSIESDGGGAGSGYSNASVNGGSGGGGGYNNLAGGTVVAHTPITNETSRTIDGDTNGQQGAHGGQSDGAKSGGGGGASQEGYAGNGSPAQQGGLGENKVMGMDDAASKDFLAAIVVGEDVGGIRYLAGGGGGCSGTNSGAGGGGGGGAGADTTFSEVATSAIANSGGGGGGANNEASSISGAGGSGIVIIRYAI